MGCLRRPKWPSTLFCVLAAVVLAAAVSISPSDAQQRPRPGVAPLPDKPAPGSLGERINRINTKWREVNLAAQVPGWRRFDAAEEWLQSNRAQQQQAVGSQQDFDRFIAGRPVASATPLTATDRARLFQELVQWNQAENRV